MSNITQKIRIEQCSFRCGLILLNVIEFSLGLYEFRLGKTNIKIKTIPPNKFSITEYLFTCQTRRVAPLVADPPDANSTTDTYTNSVRP